MPITLARIYRFPVKALRAEPLGAASLTPGQGLPHDRRFAIARGDSRVGPRIERWVPSQSFVTLMRGAALARLDCRVDVEAGTIELRAPAMTACVAPFGTSSGRQQIENYLNDFLGPLREGQVRWVEAARGAITDVPQNCLTLINLESVRELEARMGCRLDLLRFRANLYVDGAPPWREFDWVGYEIAIGDATLRIPARIPRCAVTSVNPETGERDVNVVKALRAAYGHYDMGVYGEVVRAGRVAVGDVVTPPDDARPRSRSSHWLRFFGFLARGVPVALRKR